MDVVLENKALLPMMKCMEEFGLEKGILATRDVFEKRIIGGKEFLLIPAWLLMLVY